MRVNLSPHQPVRLQLAELLRRERVRADLFGGAEADNRERNNPNQILTR